jgi:hypothetical protein
LLLCLCELFNKAPRWEDSESARQQKGRLASLSDFGVLEELTWISSELRKVGN